MLTVIGDFNKLSQKTLDSIKPIEGKVIYELVNGTFDGLTKETLFGGYRSLPGADKIKDLETGKIVSINVPREHDGKIVSRSKKFIINGGENGLVAKQIVLAQGNIEHEEWHTFFSLCNYNESNPNRDRSVEPLIRFVDEVKESKQRSAKRNLQFEALKHHDLMTDGEVLIFMKAMGWPLYNHKPSVLKDRVGDYAATNPKEFIAKLEDNTTLRSAVIRIAIEEGGISIDPLTLKSKFTAGDILFASLTKEDGKEPVHLLAEWTLTHPDGSKYYDQIKALVSGEKSKIVEVVEKKQGRLKKATEE